MRRLRDISFIVLALGLLAALVAGVCRLFDLRFSSGDLYPDYSTLNASPKGARALFESLGQVSGIEVERNFVPLLQIRNPADATLVIAGAGESFFGEDSIDNFEKFEAMIDGGCDVVVTLAAAAMPAWTEHQVNQPMKNPWRPWSVRGEGGKENTSPGDDDASRSDHDDGNGAERKVTAAERWKFSFLRAIDRNDEPRAGWRIDASAGTEPPAASPQWFSAWRLIAEDDQWQSLRQIDGKPVIIRRPFRNGSLTLLSDSAFLSNEALSRAPQPGFLLWLFPPPAKMIFDETHHGTTSTPGVMFLARRYRLLGFLCGAAGLLALFVWRAASRLVPPPPDVAAQTGQRIEGAESLGGFRDLMRQNVGRRDLLATCFAEWSKSSFVRRRYGDPQIEEIRQALAPHGTRKPRLIVESYLRAARHLRRRT